MKKILAIDDQKDNLTTIVAALETFIPDCEVITALSGKEGINLARKEQPDTILLDIIMPNMDGFEVCRRLKEDERTKRIPIILITAIKTDSESLVKGLDLGADAFLHKPIDPIEISAQVNVMLRIKESEDSLISEKNKLESIVLERTKKLRATNKELQNEILERKRANEVLDRYRHIVSNSTSMIALLDKQYTYLACNEALAEAFNLVPDQLEGKTVAEVFGKEFFSNKIKPNGDRCMNGEEVNFETWFNLPKHGKRYLDITYYPYYSEKNKIVGFVGNGRDITNRKIIEENLKDTEKRSQAWLENSPVCTKIVDLDFNLQYMSATGIRELKIDDISEYYGKPYPLHFFPDSFKTHLTNNLQKAKETGEIIKIEGQLADTKGNKMWYHHTIIPVNNNKGQLDYILVVSTDINKSVNLEKTLKNERDKLSFILKELPVGVSVLDEHHNLIYINPISMKLDGYPQDSQSILGEYVTKVHPKKIQPKVEQLLKDFKSGEKSIFTREAKRDNRTVEVSYHAIRDSKEKYMGLVRLVSDITERKRAELIQQILYNITNAVITTKSLKKLIKFTQKELGKIIDTSNYYVAFYDEDTDIISLPYMADEKESAESFPAGKSLTAHVIRSQKSLLINSSQQEKLVAEGKLEFVGTRNKVWLGVPLKSSGKTIGVIAVQSYTDQNAYDESDVEILEFLADHITIALERKKAETNLKTALDKATESDRLKSAFLANMSHEIRTPMNGILGFAELLKEPNLTGEQQQKYISIIEQGGVRMLNIINDIVSISKIESEQMEVNIQESNINKQIEYIYTFFKPEIEGKGMQFSFKNSLPLKEAIIKTDREKVYSILTNLIKNAIKYSDKSSIEFGYNKKDNFLEFYVKDTGIGIPKNRQEAIFERFIQADIADKNAYQGAGLGLSISKAYVEMLGGKIWVESKEGSGSTFYFTLPHNIETKEKITKTEISHPVEESPINNLKILIVEDDESSEEFISITVKEFAKEILSVTTGTEAVEVCLKNPDIDLVLMDIRMPEMDGYEATRQIRKFNKDVIIIAQTAYALSGDKEKAIAAGCNDNITKPIKKEELFEKIENYLRKN